MRNYVKINVSLVTMFYNAGVNFTFGYFFWHQDDPDYLTKMIARYKAHFPLNYSGGDTIQTLTRYWKLNLQDLLDSVNEPVGNGTPVFVYDAWTFNQYFPADSEFPTLIRSIFVEKSPRRKGRHG